MMKVEERITRIEKILFEEESLRRLERRSIEIVKLLLLLAALGAFLVWESFALASFVVNRFLEFKHILGL